MPLRGLGIKVRVLGRRSVNAILRFVSTVCLSTGGQNRVQSANIAMC